MIEIRQAQGCEVILGLMERRFDNRCQCVCRLCDKLSGVSQENGSLPIELIVGTKESAAVVKRLHSPACVDGNELYAGVPRFFWLKMDIKAQP